jgi:hypothetical protein
MDASLATFRQTIRLTIFRISHAHQTTFPDGSFSGAGSWSERLREKSTYRVRADHRTRRALGVEVRL